MYASRPHPPRCVRCAPVAVVLARKRLAGEKVEDCDSLEFDVVELADTMGWQLPLVKRGLRQLQWGGTYSTYNIISKSETYSLQFYLLLLYYYANYMSKSSHSCH